VQSMFGVAAPTGTPAAVIARLSSSLRNILGQPEVRDQLLAQGAIATWTTPEDAAQAIRNEYAKWAKVIKDGNIKAE
jgi:tripartite-type tricarboxylate transporter receptor subunit TctC